MLWSLWTHVGVTMACTLLCVGTFGETSFTCGAVEWGAKWEVKSCEDCREGKGRFGRANEGGIGIREDGEWDDHNKECCLPEIHVCTSSYEAENI